MKILNSVFRGLVPRLTVASLGLVWAGQAALAQDAPVDGVIASCLDQGNTPPVCICASLVLKTRIDPAQYARFGAISARIAEIESGLSAQEGEMAALTAEGYRYFVPHGQAMAICRARYGGENRDGS